MMEGYCGVTKAGESDCLSGEQGNFGFSGSTWSNATARCLARCKACRRCRYISVSMELRDCSWFAACDLLRTYQLVDSFRSMAVGESGSASLSARSSWRSHAENCPPSHEPLMQKLLLGLLQAGLVPSGSIVDAGTADGTEACSFAAVAPTRAVHALDPLALNVRAAKQLAQRAGTANLKPLVGALGDEERRMFVPQHLAQRVGQQVSVPAPDSPTEERFKRVTALRRAGPGVNGSSFPVYRLDALFHGRWTGERFGLGHFDVEGHELALLRGAARTIRRDHPLLTVELTYNAKEHAYAVALLTFLERHGYSAFVMDESVGPIRPQRNVVAVPGGSRIETSWPFMNASHFLTAITASNVHQRWPGVRK